ncbi:unnamed protein product, partial [Ixodes hexagonus]
PPQPYSFGYDNTDEFGTRVTRQETGDELNNKVGSYGYVDALGVTRTVKYVADAAGYRATVETNEPGTKTSAPADAAFLSAAVEGPHPPPQPYSFGYDNTDEFGTRLTRQETGDEFNGKTGSYSYTDAAGVHRTVNYVADAAGFRATVETNEPGTKTSAPADAPTYSSSVEVASPVVVKAAPVAVQAVHAAPVAVRAVHSTPVVHAAPFAYAHHAAPVAYAVGHGPVSYALGFLLDKVSSLCLVTEAMVRCPSPAIQSDKCTSLFNKREPAPLGANLMTHGAHISCESQTNSQQFATVACVVPRVCQKAVYFHAPQPYSFGYDNTDEFGTRLTRQETGDEHNNKVGSYGYVDAHGVARTVNYVADAFGYRATVQTNEPGTKTSEPADAPTYSSSVEVQAPVVVKAVHAVRPAPVVHVPQPYSFGYDNTDEFGTRLSRQETGDEHNNKVGSYSYVDAHGVARTVNYVADALGFRATVETNEPGTKTSAPADAPTYSSSVEVASPVVVKAVHRAPVVVKAVHPAPVVVKAVHAAPVVYAHRVAPLAYRTVAHAPLGYTTIA